MRRGVIAATAITMLAAACTSAPDGPAATSAASTDTATTDPASTDPAPSAVGVPDGPAVVGGVANSLVVVHDRDGGPDALNAYRADGTLVTRYAGGGDEVIWQPIWSPDGRRIAWTRSTDGTTWELVSAAVDGGERTVQPLPGRPDYITYDPTASQVLALTPSPDGFGLVIVDVGAGADVDEGDPPFEAVDLGRPYFSDFSPGGDRVIAHVGAELRVVDLAGERRPLAFTSSGHQTPAWHPTDDVVFFAADDETGNRLVSHDLTDATTSELAAFDAFVLFDLDPTGTRVAVSAVGGGTPDGDGGDGGLVAIAAPPRSAQPDRLGGGLWVVEVADGAAIRLAAAPTVAPMWDPTGTRVLVRTTLGGVGRWVVYGLGGEQAGTEDFDVGGTLLPGYLPFWDQYARSQTLWSPDGGQFVHAGRAESGESGVWVHGAEASGPSAFLAAGDLAFWSPT